MIASSVKRDDVSVFDLFFVDLDLSNHWLSSNHSVAGDEVSDLRGEIVNEHSSVRVAGDVDLLGIDAVVAVDLVHELSNEVNVIIASESVASTTSVESAATLVAIRPSILGASRGHTRISDVPGGPASVLLFSVIGHALWINGNDII